MYHTKIIKLKSRESSGANVKRTTYMQMEFNESEKERERKTNNNVANETSTEIQTDRQKMNETE